MIADAVSGVSGAGRGLKTTSLFSEANENVSAYGLLTHRHTAEMEQALSKVAARDRSTCCSRRISCRRRAAFSPPVTPARRRRAVDGAAARALPRFYADDPCVVVVDEPSGTKATYGANVVHVTVRFDERTDTVHRDRAPRTTW